MPWFNTSELNWHLNHRSKATMVSCLKAIPFELKTRFQLFALRPLLSKTPYKNGKQHISKEYSKQLTQKWISQIKISNKFRVKHSTPNKFCVQHLSKLLTPSLDYMIYKQPLMLICILSLNINLIH